ncbi:solute carrier family 25, member 34/35 [Cryptococcus neoformans]|nr:solute carrier family 25, member 34/35 [Cryptococcus neoformans var. grubii]
MKACSSLPSPPVLLPAVSERLLVPHSSLSRLVCKPTLPISPLAPSTTTKTRLMPSAQSSNPTASLVSGEVSAPPSCVLPWDHLSNYRHTT